jgi:two-component system heavy metal sensor histidine kinase CusS
VTGLAAAIHRARRSIAARLSLMLAAVFVLLLAGVGAHLYESLGRELAARARAELFGKVELVRRVLGELPSVRAIAAHHEHFDDILLGAHRLRLVILDAEGMMLYQSRAFSASDAALLAWLREQAVSEREGDLLYRDGVEFLVRATRSATGLAGEVPVWIGIAIDTRDDLDLLKAHSKAMLVALSLGAVLAALCGLWIIRAGLAPVRRVATVEARISGSRLDIRIPVDDAPLELVPLVEGFNSMLDRLNDSYRRLADFSSDLAHELRTPINSLIGHAHVALSRPRTAEEYRVAIESVAEEGERVASIVRDMLFLAQADNASAALKKERLDLRAELDNVVAYIAVLAEERDLTFACDGQAEVSADRAMIRRAISNLLSNALRHTSRGGTIFANIRIAGRGKVCLEISNPGPGIPAEHLPRIFDRFYQADPARKDHADVGLGLAIVKSIMDLNGGSVEAASTPGGLTAFRLIFRA